MKLFSFQFSNLLFLVHFTDTLIYFIFVSCFLSFCFKIEPSGVYRLLYVPTGSTLKKFYMVITLHLVFYCSQIVEGEAFTGF
jgi:hypothetical protein